MHDLYRAPEEDILTDLMPDARLAPAQSALARQRAETLVRRLKRESRKGLLAEFLHEYGLSNIEGSALMGLAEAFLRVPDVWTANALIQDKIGAGDWKAHLGGQSALVNTATFGLLITQAIVSAPTEAPLRKMAARLGEPAIRTAVAAAMQMMGRQFVLGQTIDEALRRSRRGLCSFDMLGEGARTQADAHRYYNSYRQAIGAVGRTRRKAPLMERHSISVKLSALHPRYEEAQADRCKDVLIDRLSQLALCAAEQGIGLTVDAEEANRLELSLDIIGAVAACPDLRGWEGLGMAVQAYQKRASAVIDWANTTSAFTGRKLAVRLVKGAYWDTEIKHAQELGLADYPVFTRKASTDVSYLACARRMLEAEHLQPAFATHNAMTMATLIQWIGPRRDVEFQRLHGMGAGLHADVAAQEGIRSRVYAPVGGYRDLLAYLVRRLLENGANSSFIHQCGDPSVSDDDLLEDPVLAVERYGGRPHPAIAKPPALFGAERLNSKGVDLSVRSELNAVEAAVEETGQRQWRASPMIDGEELTGPSQPVRSPSDVDRIVGWCVAAVPEDVQAAVSSADAAFPAWSARPVEDRAAVLDRMADLLEAHAGDLIGLSVLEAGKTLPDAVGEVREAVDFCRYYAAQARSTLRARSLPGPTGEINELTFGGRGVFACISPWNFPLAIFLGQVSAALVAGNTVVAKPAPQTPLIAAEAVRLFHRAGVPVDALHLAPGGAQVGQSLVEDSRVAGVAFTGSTRAARRIAQTLLADPGRPLSPLIAETGGLNAMIVDSTALPEQVVADVLVSAFQSAGQRCSALRLLCLQEDVYAPVMHMLQGALLELRIGDPSRITTDVGPLIDESAAARVRTYLEANRGSVGFSRGLSPSLAARGHFVAPTILEIEGPEDLTEEVFGPVLHVVRWKAGELERLVSRINRSGYGLTMGLHSRMQEAADLVRRTARVGNLYVNRSIIGAVVGVQPFGGEGLSGTGPKAGGPHYLLRFSVERAVSINTTSAGGNASLLAMNDA